MIIETEEQIKAINQNADQVRQAEIENLLPEFRETVAPFLKKGRQLLRDFEPVKVEALALAAQAGQIRNAPDDLQVLIQELFTFPAGVVSRINGAIAEAENIELHNLASPAERHSHVAYVISGMNCGDVIGHTRRLMARTRETIADLARVAGESAPLATTTTPRLRKSKGIVDDAPKTVTVRTEHRTLKY